MNVLKFGDSPAIIPVNNPARNEIRKPVIPLSSVVDRAFRKKSDLTTSMSDNKTFSGGGRMMSAPIYRADNFQIAIITVIERISILLFFVIEPLGR